VSVLRCDERALDVPDSQLQGETAVICEHARCTSTATVKTRFGDGYLDRGGRHSQRQTFVRYCDPCFQTVASLFVLCNVTLEDRPNGPLPTSLPGRHPDLVARPSP
jgi:hypothetical protein